MEPPLDYEVTWRYSTPPLDYEVTWRYSTPPSFGKDVDSTSTKMRILLFTPYDFDFC